MTRPASFYPALIGLPVAALLIALLLRISHVTAGDLASLLAGARPAPVAALVVATGLHIFLSAEKWRLVQTTLGHKPASRTTAFAYSAIGTAAGQLLPIQLANALVRGIGTRADGGGGVRGAATSLWEQLFDLWVVAVLAAPATAALLLRSPTAMIFALPALLVGAVILLPIRTLLTSWGRRGGSGRIARTIRTLTAGNLLDRSVMLKLYGLSACRILILWLMAILVAAAVGSPIAPLDLSVALPFAVLASALSMLPAGIGANELSFAGVLTHLGTPLAIATSWTLVNRLLVAQVSIAIGLAGTLLLRVRQRGPAPGQA